MSKQILVSGSLLFILLTAGYLIAYQSKPPDRPPGVAIETWIPLTDKSGISIAAHSKYFGPKDMYSSGTLYVKVANVWQRFYLEPSPAGLIPAN
jgi:hypothetical protein